MYDVICHGCRGCYHETTEVFNPDVPPRGHMFKEKPKVKELRLYSFRCSEETLSGAIECPWCNTAYQVNNKYDLKEIVQKPSNPPLVEKKPKRKYTKRKK